MSVFWLVAVTGFAVTLSELFAGLLLSRSMIGSGASASEHEAMLFALFCAPPPTVAAWFGAMSWYEED